MVERCARLLRLVLPTGLRRLLRRRHYSSVVRLPRAASAEYPRHLTRGRLIIEDKQGRNMRLHLTCPCRCGAQLSVNLMASIKPVWELGLDGAGRVSVTPSIDVVSCGSHFWLTGGAVLWVD